MAEWFRALALESGGTGFKAIVTILCNSGLVTHHSRQQLPRVSVLTPLSFGITEPLQSFSCGYLRLKDRYSLHPVTRGICFSVVPSSNPRSRFWRFVNSELVCLLPVGIFNYVTFI